MNTTWKEIDWEACAECGTSPVEAATTASVGYVYDGDEVRCPHCGEKGQAHVDSGEALICWNYASGLDEDFNPLEYDVPLLR